MKYLKLSSIYLLLLLTIGFTFQSCSDDDDKTPVNFFDDLENNQDAELLYNLSFQAVGVDYLGGDAQTLPSGRLNSLFTGAMSGGILDGNVNGTDYISVTPEGIIMINAYGTVTTTDNKTLRYRVLGSAVPNSDGATATITEQVYITSYDPDYEWLNSRHNYGVGTLDLATNTAELKIYTFQDDQFADNAPFTDPDVRPLSEFENFPYSITNLEALENNDLATLIYNGNGQLTGIESFGANVNDIFTGNFPIPAEGVYINASFTGTIEEGAVNGTISGTNYLRITQQGVQVINSKITVTTTDNVTLMLEAQGRNSADANGTAWIERTKTVTNASQYLQLNGLFNIGVGTTNIQSGEINFNHYGFTEYQK